MKKGGDLDSCLLALGEEVLQTLIRRGASLSDAEDAIQTTYYKIYQSLITINEENLRPWFFRVAINVYFDQQRKERNKTAALQKITGTAVLSTELNAFPLADFLTLVQQVKPSFQELLTLKYFYGFTEQEIATVLETSAGYVKTNLYRARKALRKQLEE